jgi:hypothetical protein
MVPTSQKQLFGPLIVHFPEQDGASDVHDSLTLLKIQGFYDFIKSLVTERCAPDIWHH